MQEVSRKLTEAWDKSGLSMSKMVAVTGLSEATLRRVRNADTGISLVTAVTVARILGVSLDELTGLEQPRMDLPEETPAQDSRLLQMYEVRLTEQKEQYEALIRNQQERYESEIATAKELYERGLASGKKRERVKAIAIIVLSIILAIYFLYFDVRNGSWGFVTYSSGIYSQNIPDTTSM